MAFGFLELLTSFRVANGFGFPLQEIRTFHYEHVLLVTVVSGVTACSAKAVPNDLVRIVIADDHVAFLSAARMLQPEFSVVGTAKNGEEVVSRVPSPEAHCIFPGGSPSFRSRTAG